MQICLAVLLCQLIDGLAVILELLVQSVTLALQKRQLPVLILIGTDDFGLHISLDECIHNLFGFVLICALHGHLDQFPQAVGGNQDVMFINDGLLQSHSRLESCTRTHQILHPLPDDIGRLVIEEGQVPIRQGVCHSLDDGAAGNLLGFGIHESFIIRYFSGVRYPA